MALSPAENIHFWLTCFCIMLASTFHPTFGNVAAATPVSPGLEIVKVGVIMEQKTTTEEAISKYMGMAWSDFYSERPSYRTRLSLHFMDPQNDVVAAASAALKLIEDEEVHAIIGPLWSEQAKFVVDLGTKAQVPVISFSATSPFLCPAQRPYFVRTAYEDSFQMRAIAAIIQAYGWREVVPIYEDTEYGNGLIPFLIDAFQEVDVKIPYRSAISPSSRDDDIEDELNRLMMMPTRVFMVHMTALLGSRLFSIANGAGMLNKGTVWIVTEGLSSLLDPVEPAAVDSMQGVIGVRPHLPASSDRLRSFKKKHSICRTHDNLFALWAYDTVWALAEAVERTWNPSKTQYVRRSSTRNSPTTALDLSDVGISELGPGIAGYMRRFSMVYGLSGHFQLVNGQLQPSAFEVFNVVGRKERVIGYWIPKYGLSKIYQAATNNNFTRKEYGEYYGSGYSVPEDVLKPPIWPGDTLEQPKGWVIPVKGKTMKIGVPVTISMKEFFYIEWPDDQGQQSGATVGAPTFSGFCYDVFLEVLNELPFSISPYEFVPFMNASRQSAGSYNDLLYGIKLGEYEMVVGDTTIVANRSSYVDFSLPYSESGVSMLVAIKDDERQNMWIFLKPLRWDLWLTAGVAFVFMGLVVWVLERHNDEDFSGSQGQRLGVSLWFSFSTLVFAHREKVHNNLTRVVVVIWVFVVLIITQSYTASLASFLTVQRLQPKFVSVQDLVKNRQYVGYLGHSFVRELLIQQLKFDPSRLIGYPSIDDFHDALSKGGANGGVDAIFDETPYLRLFLAQHCNKYTLVGPVYKTDGFGFAFRQGSPLVSYFSRAVLAVTENKDKMEAIERKNSLSPDVSCRQDTAAEQADREISLENPSLGVYSFGGLFIISAAVSLSALLVELLHSRCRRDRRRTCWKSNEGLQLPLGWSKALRIMMTKEEFGDRHLMTSTYLGRDLDKNSSRIVPWRSPPVSVTTDHAGGGDASAP
ncbi:hypothetical protein SAY87_001885 [Trapa incisa]|uniref:Glutamate receptor n=1 Tax=Trapa incisa TaxID=236973 RepID=A0AAN7PTV3_9MYRT|nr:hypothetical protein SAY87_001885 [Trapa incisa]